MIISSVEWILPVHAGATLMMTGLIWFVQIVHYPLTAMVPPSELAAYSVKHAARTTLVVAPLMVAEAVTAGLILWLQPPEVSLSMSLAGVILLIVIWSSTAVLQVRHHRSIQETGDPGRVRVLVAFNWIRTVAWSGRAVIGLVMLTNAGSG